jgi:hypothetical protein
VAVPETVTVAMAEIAEDMGEGLLALAVGTGLQVMSALMALMGRRRERGAVRAASTIRTGPGCATAPSGAR